MKNPHRFRDLIIRFERQTYYTEDETVFQATVVAAPFPLQGGPLRADVDAHMAAFQQTFAHTLTLEQFFYDYEIPSATSTVHNQDAQSDLANVGEALYDLLPVTFRHEFPRLLQRVYERDEGIRLILEAQAGNKADRLLGLPWELLFLLETEQFLARTPRLLVVRRLLGAPRRSAPVMAAPYHLVHVIAAGSTSSNDFIEEELQRIEKETLPVAVGKAYYTLVADPGSMENFHAALEQTQARVLHFLGHGSMTQDSADEPVQGYLHFVDAAGNVQYVSGDRLQHLVGGRPGIQLVILNACRSGATVSANLALSLVNSGFPYVVVMQGDVTQRVLIPFVQGFYQALQSGAPVEYAVAAGRYRIGLAFPSAVEWCLPTLYTSAGVAEKPLWDRLIEPFEWMASRSFVDQAIRFATLFGLLHLVVGLLLWISGATQSLPDAAFLARTTAWLALAPPLMAVWAYYREPLPLPPDLPRTTRWALVSRLFNSIALAIGFFVLYGVYFMLALIVGLGFWGLLTPLAQGLILAPLLAAALLLGYAQARSHGWGFVENNRIRAISFTFSEFIFAVAGYGMLLGPLILLDLGGDLLAPPWLNLMIGAINVAAGFFLYWEERRAPSGNGRSRH